ncbi:MAG: SRPBCC family protein [Actinomycetota bacterium]|nr:SRPBCC family protein [Actinomycetota bacterium]
MEARQVSVTRVIDASPERVFEVLVDPAAHPLIDGSGTIKETRAQGGTRLVLGSKFGMAMKLGVPYGIVNEVVEFEEGRLIAWRHFGGHRWRWQLEPVDGGTAVTETFDWSTSRSPIALEVMRVPARNKRAIEATLGRLAAHLAG